MRYGRRCASDSTARGRRAWRTKNKPSGKTIHGQQDIAGEAEYAVPTFPGSIPCACQPSDPRRSGDNNSRAHGNRTRAREYTTTKQPYQVRNRGLERQGWLTSAPPLGPPPLLLTGHGRTTTTGACSRGCHGEPGASGTCADSQQRLVRGGGAARRRTPPLHTTHTKNKPTHCPHSHTV